MTYAPPKPRLKAQRQDNWVQVLALYARYMTKHRDPDRRKAAREQLKVLVTRTYV